MRAVGAITVAIAGPPTSDRMNITQTLLHGHPTYMAGRSSALPRNIYLSKMERQGIMTVRANGVVHPRRRPRSVVTHMTTRHRLVQGWIQELEQGSPARINRERHPAAGRLLMNDQCKTPLNSEQSDCQQIAASGRPQRPSCSRRTKRGWTATAEARLLAKRPRATSLQASRQES
jgi:hypothetical protein